MPSIKCYKLIVGYETNLKKKAEEKYQNKAFVKEKEKRVIYFVQNRFNFKVNNIQNTQ